jgi:hypothetical protein
MDPLEETNKIVESQQKMVVIWGALLTSQFIFLMVLYLIKKELFHIDLSQPLAGKNPALVGIAALLSLTTLTLSFALKTRVLKQSEVEQNVGLVQTALIVSYAFCESVSLIGFMLAMMIDYQYFFLWFAAGIAGIALHFPRRKYIERASYKNNV